MMSQGETYVWDLDSNECVVTIPPVDAEPNWPTWTCEIGDSIAFYTIKDEDDKKHNATASTLLRIEASSTTGSAGTTTSCLASAGRPRVWPEVRVTRYEHASCARGRAVPRIA